MRGVEAQVAIVSLADDLHALLIAHELNRRSDVRCSVVEMDTIATSGGLHWTAPTYAAELDGRLPVRGGDTVRPADLDAVWWRRASYDQRPVPGLTGKAELDVVNNDCRASLLGTLATDFSGAWISDPAATRLAENKLVQLVAAHRAGLRIPRTIVSQDHGLVQAFRRDVGEVVVKPVRGTHKRGLLTRAIAHDTELPSAAVELCPAIYQELIRGDHHVRALCFGNEVLAVEIESELLDWRERIGTRMTPYDCPRPMREQLAQVLRTLGIRMGVADLKLADDGSSIFLELNAQGQFLFAQGLADVDFVTPFADFLRREALEQRRARPAPDTPLTRRPGP